MKKRITIDRLLLLMILIMQIGILASFYINKQKHEEIMSRQPQVLLPSSIIESPESYRRNHATNSFDLAEVETMHNQMNRMMAQAMNEFEYMQELIDADDIWHTMPATPAMDMRETDDSYMIAFSLPGISPASITVTLDGRELSVLSQEHGGALNTRILLPGPVKDSDFAKSVFTNGVLTVNVPKNNDSIENIDGKIGL